MQFLLTEEEYMVLKGKGEEMKRTYVKRIDVSLALQELEKELRKCFDTHGIYFNRSGVGLGLTETEWRSMFENFVKSINL